MSGVVAAAGMLTQWHTAVPAAVGDEINGIGAHAGVPDLVMLSVLLGVFMPPLVAVVQQPRWSPILRAVVVIASSVGVGAITTALEGDITGQRWTTAALIVGAAAVSAHRMFWRHAAQSIETHTPFRSAPGRQ